MDDVNKLQKQIEMMEKRIKSLQESVGRWKRKARGAKGNFTYVSERHEHGRHFISISVPNVPADSTIHEVQRFIRKYVLPKYAISSMEKVDYIWERSLWTSFR